MGKGNHLQKRPDEKVGLFHISENRFCDMMSLIIKGFPKVK